MTVKEFARLCGCNPQTLRYYDHMELLKPVKVDPWTGYRHYDKEQSLAFIRIKNLQSAGFTIAEIRELLPRDNDAICEAFDRKIAEQEALLAKLKTIRRSYHSEINEMSEKLQQMRDAVRSSMQKYDAGKEFGIDPETYKEIIEGVSDFFENMIANEGKNDLEMNFTDFHESAPGEEPYEEAEYLNFLDNPEYDLIYEKHGWKYVKDFLDEFTDLTDDGEYALLFQLAKEKADGTAFCNTMLGILTRRDLPKQSPEPKRTLGVNVTDSPDGKNHFLLFRKK